MNEPDEECKFVRAYDILFGNGRNTRPDPGQPKVFDDPDELAYVPWEFHRRLRFVREERPRTSLDDSQ